MDALLQKIQIGDPHGFRQFYELNFFKLYQFSYSFIHAREPSEELVNDVFLSLWLKRKEVGSIRNIKVFLYVSVKNACLNFLRTHNMQVPVSVDNLCVDHLQMGADPERVMIQRELQIQIREAVEQLPPRCRLIFKLVKEDGLSYKEVASILGLSTNTVDSQLCLALKKLAVLLQPLLPTRK